MIDTKYIEHIAGELSLKPAQVAAAIELMDGGATIPFVAHFRKDATDGLDEERLEAIAERSHYFIGVANRRNALLAALEKNQQLTDDLRARIDDCYDKTVLDDLHQPLKPRRPNKATLAEERGLAPLADFIMKQLPGLQIVEDFAGAFLKPEKGVSSPEEAFEGALYILVDRFTLDAEARGIIRRAMLSEGKVVTRATKNAEGKKTKYEAYYDFSDPVAKIPSHRMLAILRGEKEGLLRVDVSIDDEKTLKAVTDRFITQPGSPFEPYVRVAVQEAYERHLRPGLEKEVMELLRERAEKDAIRVFRENARNLLMSPGIGRTSVIGIVPGADGAWKFVVVDASGGFVEHQGFVVPEDGEQRERAAAGLVDLMNRHQATVIAIENVKGASEVLKFARDVVTRLGREGAFAVLVSAGPAGNYAGSKIARDELPDVETSLREAVSIARRTQDPLAEFVKVEPRGIGVGQYQHDVNQKELREGLHRTVVSCVNQVGVDLNSASASLLKYVSGIQLGTAESIVAYRAKVGRFSSRKQLHEVDGVGPRVFEQCAGFLRVEDGEDPLDATAIHPESYEIVGQMASSLGATVKDLLRNPDMVSRIDLSPFQTAGVGSHLLNDIKSQLLKPGKDGRGVLVAPKTVAGASSIEELEEGIDIEGVVTNVTNFGAFVDIGVQQDGLVHLSELSSRFVKDPREVIKVGDVVRVKVIKVDKQAPRISLSMKALEPPRPRRQPRRPEGPREGGAPESAEGRPPYEGRPRRRPEGPPQVAGEGRPEGEAPRRGPRPERPRGDRPDRERREGEGPRGPRPDRRDREDRRGGERPDRGPRRGDRERTREAAAHGAGHGAPKQEEVKGINTLLADQLAALRDKFKS